MGDSISKLNEIRRREHERFEEMREKLLKHHWDAAEEFRDKKKQKFRKRKLPFTK